MKMFERDGNLLAGSFLAGRFVIQPEPRNGIAERNERHRKSRAGSQEDGEKSFPASCPQVPLSLSLSFVPLGQLRISGSSGCCAVISVASGEFQSPPCRSLAPTVAKRAWKEHEGGGYAGRESQRKGTACAVPCEAAGGCLSPPGGWSTCRIDRRAWCWCGPGWWRGSRSPHARPRTGSCSCPGDKSWDQCSWRSPNPQ
jgi:hypothetical protein